MSSNNRKTGNLVALGSAAVVAVYGAGFMRTAAAAERFAQQSDERVLSPAEAEVIAAMANELSSGVTAASNTASIPTDSSTRAPRPEPAAGKVDATTAKVSSIAVTEATASSPSSTVGSAAAIAAVPPKLADSSTTGSATASTHSASVTATPAVTAPAVMTAPTSSPAPTPANAAATTANAPQTTTPSSAPAPAAAKAEETAPTAAAPLKWKDGGYTGYGTSRHGDIEVYLETEGGKISYIKISQCLTQYSCSWISELPGQVIARQGPKVDAISGATQSANAFYYAVVQALSKAK